MDMKLARELLNIRNKHRDAVYFYANLKSGLCYVEENQYIPEELSVEGTNVLLELYNGPWVIPEDMGKIINFYERIMQGTREAIHMDELLVQVHMKNRDGVVQLFSIICFLETDEQGLITSYIGKLRAMKPKELEEREILAQFSNDKNPAIFIKRIAQFQAEHPERKYAYIQFDIRKFRYINETYGMEAGDKILQYISDTLKILCDDTHLYSRPTADLFEVVTYYNSREEILDFINLLDSRLHRCGDIRFNMSFGIKVVDGTDVRYRKSGDEAGLAREYVKTSIQKKAAFFEDTLMEKIVKSGAIEEAEDEALQNDEFKVYLQPKYHYDGKEARIIGAEALVRWIDAEGRMKSPAEFIPVFEENGFILELDQFMWEEVCKLLRHWLEEGKTPIPISVNVSRSYLHKFDVVNHLKNLVNKYQIPINLLQLEITETTESEETIAYAKRFKDAGFTLMMDDFGSGYSSLSMLKNTPFDVLKMDRFFLVECMESEYGKIIVSHVISMSSDLGLDVIAEGVETKEMADFLYTQGCEVSQGYYFSKPVSIPEFEELWEAK